MRHERIKEHRQEFYENCGLPAGAIVSLFEELDFLVGLLGEWVESWDIGKQQSRVYSDTKDVLYGQRFAEESVEDARYRLMMLALPCEYLHHDKSEQHEHTKPCPLKKRLALVQTMKGSFPSENG